jgi:hypothetical protein
LFIRYRLTDFEREVEFGVPMLRPSLEEEVASERVGVWQIEMGEFKLSYGRRDDHDSKNE